MSHYRLHFGERSSHMQISRLLRELKCGPVLDVGCAQGMIGRLLEGSGIDVDAVEPNTAWAEAARPFYQTIHVGAIEQVELERGRYGAIVCADVLEHTIDPLAVLRRLRDFASDDATFIVSLPNVAHIAVRTMLLFGRFPRMESGILDKTHLHFFTRDTAEGLLREAGLRIEHVSATPVPPSSLGSKGLVRRAGEMLMPMQCLAVDFVPRLFAMQWIFVARK